jgi:hypothetical protein
MLDKKSITRSEMVDYWLVIKRKPVRLTDRLENWRKNTNNLENKS